MSGHHHVCRCVDTVSMLTPFHELTNGPPDGVLHGNALDCGPCPQGIVFSVGEAERHGHT